MWTFALLRGQSNVLKKDYVIISSLIKDINPHILRSFTSSSHFTDPKPFWAETLKLSALDFKQHICAPILKVKILAEMSEVAILGVLFQSCVYNGGHLKVSWSILLWCCKAVKTAECVFHCNNTRNYPVLLCSLSFVHYFSQSGFQDIPLGILERDSSLQI